MNRAQLEHLIRASGDIAGVQDIIILGSQAILGQFPELAFPDFRVDSGESCSFRQNRTTLVRSMEADILIPGDEEKADLIDGVLGELSPFHSTHGYYAQGVDSSTALLPEGWKQRLITICNDNTNHIKGHCVEIHDLIIAKLYAGRHKDIEFFRAAVRLRLVKKYLLLERLDMLSLSEERRNIITHCIEKGFENE